MLEVLDRKKWNTRHELSNAIFDWIECWYNLTRRHSALKYIAPIEYETTHPRALRGLTTTTNPTGKPGEGQSRALPRMFGRARARLCF